MYMGLCTPYPGVSGSRKLQSQVAVASRRRSRSRSPSSRGRRLARWQAGLAGLAGLQALHCSWVPSQVAAGSLSCSSGPVRSCRRLVGVDDKTSSGPPLTFASCAPALSLFSLLHPRAFASCLTSFSTLSSVDVESTSEDSLGLSTLSTPTPLLLLTSIAPTSLPPACQPTCLAAHQPASHPTSLIATCLPARLPTYQPTYLTPPSGLRCVLECILS